MRKIEHFQKLNNLKNGSMRKIEYLKKLNNLTIFKYEN